MIQRRGNKKFKKDGSQLSRDRTSNDEDTDVKIQKESDKNKKNEQEYKKEVFLDTNSNTVIKRRDNNQNSADRNILND